MKRILIVGGGASGMAAALSAAKENPKAEITILEGLERVGKKLLATGNGRCNLGNAEISPACYHSARPDALARLLAEMPAEKTLDFFEELGLMCAPDEAGRLYPYCRQAGMVLDVLLLALKRAGVTVACAQTAASISCRRGEFSVRTETGEVWRADAVILSTGGKAAPKQGITGVGYRLAEEFGHRCTALSPCLVPLKSGHRALRGLKGIRVQCKTTLLADGAPVAAEEGELQLTDYGISGIPAMQLSCFLGALRGREIAAEIDFFPAMAEEALLALLRRRAADYGAEPIEGAFLGLIHKRVLFAVMKDAGVEGLARPAAELKEKELRRLALALKGWQLPIEGTLSWDQAQVTGGGIALEEVDGDFMSRLRPGLYLTGELLDAEGICGGYNLHWAWCSGMAAGRAAAREEEK